MGLVNSPLIRPAISGGGGGIGGVALDFLGIFGGFVLFVRLEVVLLGPFSFLGGGMDRRTVCVYTHIYRVYIYILCVYLYIYMYCIYCTYILYTYIYSIL